MEPSGVAAPARKRRACVNCTVAKSKCTSHSETVCERCARLDKGCVYLDLPQKRRKQRDSRRVDALENKVNGLLAQLAAFTERDASTTQTPAGLPTPYSHDETCPVIQPAVLSQAVNTDSRTARANQPGNDDIVDRGLIKMIDARTLIANFKQFYVRHFPFAALGPEETADWLRAESPFLFLCIIGATSYAHPSRQRAVSEEITRQLSTQLLLGAERSMDLLRGLLVHAAWYQHVAQRGHAQILMMTQLCVTIAHDLDLNGVRELSFEEIRAFLGAYWLSVCVSRSIGKQTGMRHTKHIDDCVRKIATTPEFPEDQLIRPSMLLQTLASSLIDYFGYAPATGFASRGDKAVHFMTESLMRELEQIKASITADVADCRSLLELETHYLRGWIWEIALRDEFWEAPFHDGAATVQLTRTTMLWQLVRAHNEFIQRFLAIPDTEMPHLSFVIFTRLCSVLINQAKAAWSLLEAIRGPGVTLSSQLTPSQKLDGQMVIDEVNYPDDISAILQKLSVITREPCAVGWDKHVLVQFCTKLYACASYYSKETMRLIGSSGVASTGAGLIAQADNVPLSVSSDVQRWLGVAGIANRDTTTTEEQQTLSDTNIFDQLLWDSILNDFSGFSTGL